MYGPCSFADECWSRPLPQMKLPDDLTDSFMNQVFAEDPVPTEGGVSLEGQATGAPDFTDARQAFALSQLANGTVVKAICPPGDLTAVDPVLNINSAFPPTFIVHGMEDSKVPIALSRQLLAVLRRNSIVCDMVEIPGEEHTFAAKMRVGSETWNLQRRGFDFLSNLVH